MKGLDDQKSAPALSASSAFRFVLALGLVNLFADMTYEGGASINGPFLGSLGAGAAAISIIAGTGEFLGYSLRLLAGHVADRTGKYWLITFLGYSINLLAVPAMALADHWLAVAALVFAERMGRATRKPTVEAMLSYTTSRYGKGWVYALNTALDETSAALGPLLIALVLLGAGGTATCVASSCAGRAAEPLQAHGAGGGGRASVPAGRGWASAAKRRSSVCVS
jgi:hypothetical protein